MKDVVRDVMKDVVRDVMKACKGKVCNSVT